MTLMSGSPDGFNQYLMDESFSEPSREKLIYYIFSFFCIFVKKQ